MRFKTHDTEITKEVLTMAFKRTPAGEVVTDEAWNFAYQIVLAGHQLCMIAWKHDNLTIKEAR